MIVSTDRNDTNRIAQARSRKWASGVVTMLLGASLILAACGGGSDPVVEEGDDAAPTTAAPAAETETEETEEPAATAAATTPEVEETEATETEGTAETEVMTETDTIVDTEVITQVTETEVLTETEVTTDTDVIIGETEVTTQTEDMDDTETMTETEGTGNTGATAGAATGAATEGMMGVSGIESQQFVRASTLLDYDFENVDGEVSGDLEDIFIDLSTGRVLFAAIEYGGVLDLGDKDVVIPLNAFSVGEEGELVLNIDEASLENYPDVGNDWPDLNDPAWDDDVNAFWNEAGVNVGEGYVEPTTSVARASDLMGVAVGDLGAGEGAVQDILVDLQSGQARYVIVDYGADAGTEEGGPYIVPFRAFDTANWSEGLTYGPDFTAETLQNAPRFDIDTYPAGTPLDPGFGADLDTTWDDLGFGDDEVDD